ncbi:hypothetical protein D3C87_111180 [compost metagenome]
MKSLIIIAMTFCAASISLAEVSSEKSVLAAIITELGMDKDPEVIALEKRIEAACDKDVKCELEVYSGLLSKTIPNILKNSLALVAEAQRLNGPDTATFDEMLIPRALRDVNSFYKRTQEEGLTQVTKVFARWHYVMAVRDSLRLQKFVSSLQK